MEVLLRELKNLKAKQKSLQKECAALMQRIEHLEQLAKDNDTTAVDHSVQIAVKKAALRRGKLS